MIEHKIPKITIFEDDITSYIGKNELENQLYHLFSKIPIDWDIIFLGYFHPKRNFYIKRKMCR